MEVDENMDMVFYDTMCRQKQSALCKCDFDLNDYKTLMSGEFWLLDFYVHTVYQRIYVSIVAKTYTLVAIDYGGKDQHILIRKMTQRFVSLCTDSESVYSLTNFQTCFKIKYNHTIK